MGESELRSLRRAGYSVQLPQPVPERRHHVQAGRTESDKVQLLAPDQETGNSGAQPVPRVLRSAECADRKSTSESGVHGRFRVQHEQVGTARIATAVTVLSS